MIVQDEKLFQYEEALEALIMTYLIECDSARTEKRKPRVIPKIVGCASAIVNTWVTDPQVKGVVMGIAMQANPKAALVRTVNEYNKVMAEIEKNGSVVLDFDRG